MQTCKISGIAGRSGKLVTPALCLPRSVELFPPFLRTTVHYFGVRPICPSNTLCPEGLQNKFRKRPAVSNYNTRNMKNLHVQKLKSEHAKKLFVHSSELLEYYPTGH